jgi:GntR family transcriptional regulator/MocR family aminotransferase
MPKRTTAFELTLPWQDAGVPAYRLLYESIRSQILEGSLRPGTRLPATRDLGRQYQLSRGTIVNAFELLKSEGYLEGSVGSGTYVSKVLPDELLRVRRDDPRENDGQPSAKSSPRRRVSDFAKRASLFPFESRPVRAFRANLPALDLFPADLWAQITNRRMRKVSTNLLSGCDPMGYHPLRVAVADYLGTSRGVRCVPGQIGIVSGVQEALDLAARLLLNPGDRVCMENPGYVGAGFVFQALGAKLSFMSLDNEGMELHTPALR